MKLLINRMFKKCCLSNLDRVLYAKKTGDEEECAATILGGEKITLEEACVSLHRVIAKVKLNLEFRLRPSQLQLRNSYISISIIFFFKSRRRNLTMN